MGLGQFFKERTSEKEKSSSSFKDKFEQISKHPATRTIKLRTETCCGCGCTDIEFYRTVPYDSPLQDGDFVKRLEKGDDVI